VEVIVPHHTEYFVFEVLSLSWSGVGCSYVTGTQLPTSWGKKVSLLAEHAQTVLLLSLFIPPRSASPAIWKGIVNSSHLTSLSLPLFSPFPSPRLFTCTIFICRLIITPFLTRSPSQLCIFILFCSLRCHSDFLSSFLRSFFCRHH